MKRYTLFVLFLGLCLHLSAQIIIPKKDYQPKVGTSRYSFGVSLVSSSHTSLTSYGIVRQNPDSTIEIQFLTFDTFIHQISGHQKSKANPDQINYLDEYGISIDDFKALWKLKFDNYPYEGSKELGFGTELGAPSSGQYELLKPYGITTIADYCFGDNLWRFMLKFKDPAWNGVYQQRK